MHNVSLFKASDGSIRVRFFKNHIFTHDKKKSVKKRIYTPFIDQETLDLSYGYEIEAFFPDELEAKRNESLRCSISRTKNKVLKIALSGNFDYFCTFTFNPNICNRYDYDSCCKVIQSWLHSLPDHVQYLIVPEKHKDGAFHFHGLFSHFDDLFFSGDYKIGKVYHCKSINFGFHSFVPIQDRTRVSRYIVKYFTKDLISVSKGRRRYWYSYSNIFVESDVNLILTLNSMRKIIDLVKERGLFYAENKVFFLEYDEVWFPSGSFYDFLPLFQPPDC